MVHYLALFPVCFYAIKRVELEVSVVEMNVEEVGVMFEELLFFAFSISFLLFNFPSFGFEVDFFIGSPNVLWTYKPRLCDT